MHAYVIGSKADVTCQGMTDWIAEGVSPGLLIKISAGLMVNTLLLCES